VQRGEQDTTDGSETPQPNGNRAAPEQDAEPKPLGQEAPEIIEEASRIGEKRLQRSLAGSAITAFIGGMSVSFGAVAMIWASSSVSGEVSTPSNAHLLGSLFFPVGFIILLVGKSELFTENFFLPVTAILERNGSLRELGKLWSISLCFNLLGGLVFALLISRGHVLDSGPANQFASLAEHKVAYGFWTAFVKAIFAGWLMTMLTWLLVAAESFGSRLAIIWMIGTLIVLGQFNHVIISAAEIFIAILTGADVTFRDWFVGNFIPALLGNVIGGVVFVTLLFYVQAQYHLHDRQENGQ
jgi:formate/nitrite transporter FocA (FNT family)